MLYFPQKIIKTDETNGQPLWLEPMIYAYSEEGTKTRVLNQIFSFRNEQLYTTSDPILWNRDDVRRALLDLKNVDRKEKAREFFISNITNFITRLENVLYIESVEMADSNLKIKIRVFNEENEEVTLFFCFDVFNL